MGVGEVLYRFFLVIGIGMLMGIERDHNWRSDDYNQKEREQSEIASKKFSFINVGIPARGLGGLRTYTLISILGALSGLAYRFGMYSIPTVVLIVFSLFILVSFILNYFDKNTLGLTTEISIILLLLISILMFAVDIPLKLLVGIAIVSILFLSLKTEARGFVSKFSGLEIVDTVKFLLFTVVILPFLPNTDYTFGMIASKLVDGSFLSSVVVINPFKIWLMVVIISSVNFIAYFLVKVVGTEKGIPITGFLGGFISSTAVTQAMATKSREISDNRAKDAFVEATILANLTSFWRVILVASIFNLELAKNLFIPMTVFSIILFAVVLFIKKQDKKKPQINSITGVSYKSPFSIGPSLKFAGLFLIISLFTKLAHELLGNSGFIISSMLSSVSGLDVITINTASAVHSIISMNVAILTIVAASIVNFLVKTIIIYVFADKYFRKKVLLSFALSSMGGILAVLPIILSVI